MMIITHFTTAVKQLLANKGKAALTMLGVVIGIGSVILIMTLGEISKNFLLGQITQFGTNVVEIAVSGEFGPFGSNENVKLTDEDVQALDESSLLPEITNISAGYSSTEAAEYNGEQYTVSIFADNPSYLDVNNLTMLSGRFFNTSDYNNSSRVVVIGEQFAEDLFDTKEKAINKTISIGGNSFTIIGVTQDIPLGNSFGAQVIVYAPLTTVRRLFVSGEDQNTVTYMLVQFEQGTDAASFEKRIKYELNRIKNTGNTNSDAFLVASREQFLEIFDTVLLGIQMFVSAIAGISLVVGGIGIMNIMLVTVRERTKEIGLRKAVGAKNSSILTQFLIEAIVLTTVGGILGIGFGLGFSLLAVIAVNLAQPTWGIAFTFVPSSILLACSVAITTGIVFGLYPAVKASRLHPIESLRYE